MSDRAIVILFVWMSVGWVAPKVAREFFHLEVPRVDFAKEKEVHSVFDTYERNTNPRI